MASQLVLLSAAVLLGLLLPFSMADNVMYVGDKLYAGQSLNQGAYTFIMQSDCNLVLYDNGKAVWSTETEGLGRNCFLLLKTDGNLVILSDDNKIVWQTNTGGSDSEGKFVLVLQRDRNVVLYGCPIWATHTNADELTNRKIAMAINN